MKVAVLSNVNSDSIIRELSKKYTMYLSQGYGNLFETLLNKESAYYQFQADITVIWIDVVEFINHRFDYEYAKERIDTYFQLLEKSIAEKGIYFLSDIDFRGYPALTAMDLTLLRKMEAYWNNCLETLRQKNSNTYRFEYKKLVETIGRQKFYSEKMWYLGKMPLSMEAIKSMSAEIDKCIETSRKTPKKVLLLDLDNTLWGGVIGEDGLDRIQLSDEKTGGIYKDVQRIIYKIKENGVLLGIVSKNNEKDALEAINQHPHMLIRDADITIKKINWINKDENIRAIAKELNVGLDSMVFIDDNPMERELVSMSIPEVTVPEFPKDILQYPKFMYEIYQNYFRKLYLTEEDLKKTDQYQANSKREELKTQFVDYEQFLKELKIKVTPVDAEENLERIHQLINKTNQFNLTVKRRELQELQEMLKSMQYQVFAFRVEDKFGDTGIVSVIITRAEGTDVYIENFLMSCRVMGRKIENYIIEYVENYYERKGFENIYGVYVPGPKNQAVAEYFSGLGYLFAKESEIEKWYKMRLSEKRKRVYFVEEN